MIDTKELRRLAQAATSGEWYVERGNHIYGRNEVTDGEEVWHPVIACTDDDEVSINFEGNAKFIAAANPAVINELLDRLEAAEKERDVLRHCFNEWGDKTEWVQRGIDEGTISPKYVGLHRADVMARLLGAAEKERDKLKELNIALCTKSNSQVIHNARLAEENDALRAKIEAAERERDALRNEIAFVKEVEFPRKAQAVADAWEGKCKRLEVERDALRAKIEHMENQEPVAEWLPLDSGEDTRRD